MNPFSWAKKEFARIRLQKQQRRLLLPPRCSSSTTANCFPIPPVQEVIISADLRCGECQRRIAGILSKFDGEKSTDIVLAYCLNKNLNPSRLTVGCGVYGFRRVREEGDTYSCNHRQMISD